MKSVVEQGLFHEFEFDNKALKFEFELRHISTLVHRLFLQCYSVASVLTLHLKMSYGDFDF